MRVASEQFPIASYKRRGMYSGGGNALASSFMQTAKNNPERRGGPLDAVLEELLALAREAARHSYSPYSAFKVGAALKLTSGEIVTGTNVENDCVWMFSQEFLLHLIVTWPPAGDYEKEEESYEIRNCPILFHFV